MIQSIQQGLLADGVTVSIARLCAWFGVPRRTVCYTPVKAAPKVDPRFAEPIKAMIEAEPSFGYRTVAWLLGFNKNTVQRIFQLKGWQVRKRAIGIRPRIQAVPSVATAPNERWSTDLARVWTGKDGWPPPTFAPSRHGKLARCAGQPRRAGCRPPHRGAGGAMPNASPSAPSSGLSRAGCRTDRSRFLPS